MQKGLTRALVALLLFAAYFVVRLQAATAFAHLTDCGAGGTCNGGTSDVTASVTWTSGSVGLVTVHARGTGLAAGADPTISGPGGTWAVPTNGRVNGWDDANDVIYLLVGTGSLSNGTVTVNFPVSVTTSYISVEEATEVHATVPIVQCVNNSGAGTSATATLSAFADSTNNRPFGFFASATNTPTAEATWTSLHTTTSALFGVYEFITNWRSSADTSYATSLNSPEAWAVIACEFDQDAGGGGAAAVVRGPLMGVLP